MFKVGGCMIGVQAHPEFSKSYHRGLVTNKKESPSFGNKHVAMKALNQIKNTGCVYPSLFFFFNKTQTETA